MALDRLIVQTGTGPAVSSSIQEEVTGLWNRSICSLTSIGGTGNAITASLDPALTAGLVDGMPFWLTPASNNTGAVTIAINGASAVDVVDVDGNPLGNGDLAAGRRYLVVADSGDLRVVSGGGSSGGYNVVEFKSGGTWTKPDGLKKVRVRVRGGGGGGGGVSGNGVSGGGGGGGGEAVKEVNASSLGGTETVTVGSGGAAGSSGGGTGGNGGASSFGSHASANGGTGGTSTNGGVGGAGTVGDVLLAGQRGEKINTVELSIGSSGGASPTGGFGPGYRTTTGNGEDALANSGCGGSGGLRLTAGNAAGGAGGSGMVIVEEFF